MAVDSTLLLDLAELLAELDRPAEEPLVPAKADENPHLPALEPLARQKTAFEPERLACSSRPESSEDASEHESDADDHSRSRAKGPG